MRIARMISPVHSLGPGDRVCLWTQGCSKRCPGCISPELQPFRGEDVGEALLADILIGTAQRGNCTGLTISGGDPLEQPEELLRLLKLVRQHFADILVYTGYLLEDIRSGKHGEAARDCLELMDVLIDGPYIREENLPDCVLRGSANQTIHYLTSGREEPYAAYMAKGRVLESFCHNGSMIITGIQNRRDLP